MNDLSLAIVEGAKKYIKDSIERYKKNHPHLTVEETALLDDYRDECVKAWFEWD